MKATKKSSAWDVDKLPIKMVATFTGYEDREVKSGKKTLNIFDFKFEIDDIEGQEDFAELEITKGLWYTRDDEGGVQMSTPNFQVTEALEGLDKDDTKDDGEQSDDFEELVGNRVLLTILESKKNPGYAEIDRVDPYDDEDDEDEDERPRRKKKKGKKAEKPKRKKKKPEPEPDDDEDDDDDDEDDDDEDDEPPRRKKKKKRDPEPDDEDEDDEPPRKKRRKKKAKPESEDDDEDKKPKKSSKKKKSKPEPEEDDDDDDFDFDDEDKDDDD